MLCMRCMTVLLPLMKLVATRCIVCFVEPINRGIAQHRQRACSIEQKPHVISSASTAYCDDASQENASQAVYVANRSGIARPCTFNIDFTSLF
jgi:hypothetical protein